MKVYVVVVNDRHADPEIKLFKDEQKALGYAEQAVQDTARHPEDIERDELNDFMKRDGWIYYVRYSCEGDYIVVYEREVLE